MFGILSSVYNFLLQEELALMNPVVLIRQKSKFLRKEAQAPMIRRLSDKQWRMVIRLVQQQAEADVSHERTVFILSCLYGMYLRISELVSVRVGHLPWETFLKTVTEIGGLNGW